MNSGSASAPMQPVSAGLTPPPMTTPGGGLKLHGYPGEDAKPEYEPSFSEHFSKSNLKLKVAEYFGGKYTDRYIQNYLEFMVINGMLNNLEYLEFKNLISLGKQS